MGSTYLHILKKCYRWLIGFCCFCPFWLQGQTIIKGIVINKTSQEPLIGANIYLKNTLEGSTTDVNGRFIFQSNNQFPIILTVSYTGYVEKEITLSKAITDLQIALEEGVLLDKKIIVSASRKKERTMDAPSSISILEESLLAAEALSSPVQAMRNTMGVDVSQRGTEGFAITLRGTNSIFLTESAVQIDYRNSISPGLNAIAFGATTLNKIDLARIEIIRGPGSALYGPGVEAGVIHFLTKDPFRYPGTTVNVTAGERSAFQTSLRHAAVLSKKIVSLT